MAGYLSSYTYQGSATISGRLGSLEFFQVSTVVSSGGGGATFTRLAFNDANRLFPDGTALRLFPVT